MEITHMQEAVKALTSSVEEATAEYEAKLLQANRDFNIAFGQLVTNKELSEVSDPTADKEMITMEKSKFDQLSAMLSKVETMISSHPDLFKDMKL